MKLLYVQDEWIRNQKLYGEIKKQGEELYEEILEEVSSSGATAEVPKDDEASYR